MPPASHKDRSKPQGQRAIQVRDSASILSAHFFGRSATNSFCIELIIGSFLVVLRYAAEPVFDRRSAVKLYRSFAAEHGVVNLDASYCETSCDGSPVPMPCYAALFPPEIIPAAKPACTAGPTEPRFLEQVANACRVRRSAYRTEQSYVAWVRRFILFHNKRHPMDRKALNALSMRLQNQTFRPRTGRKLAATIDRSERPESIPSFIRDLRKRISKRMRSMNIESGPDDVIVHTEHGYQLREWLTVHNAEVSDDAEEQGQQFGKQQDDGTVDGPVGGTLHGTVDRRTERRNWILEQVTNGRKMRAPAFAAELKCSERTVKRDLDALEDQIEFEGSPNSGYYRLRQVKKAR